MINKIPNTSLNTLPSIFKLSDVTIKDIFIIGNKIIEKNTILAKIPRLQGNKISARLASLILKNIYNMGYFSSIDVRYDEVEPGFINLYIIVEEKKRVVSINITGNNNVSFDSIDKKCELSKIQYIDNYDMKKIILMIKKLYEEKQYHNTRINYLYTTVENDSVEVTINVDEGIYGRIRSILFTGNKYISSKQLKEIIGSRENWLLGFLDRGGVFKKELVEYDRYQIESFYQARGFFEARIISVSIDESKAGDIDIIYRISEGPLYNFGIINYVYGDDIIEDNKIKKLSGIVSGDLYSKDKIRNAIMGIKAYLGECGFMYANIMPKQKINKESNLIDIEFVINKGKQIYVRYIDIKNNLKTRNDIIRREILLNEGELITTKKLAQSKRMVESLGFFTPQSGVKWDLQTIDNHCADLTMIVQDYKTGRFYFNVGVNSGSDAGRHLQENSKMAWYDSLLTASRIGITLQDTNWKGQGIRYFIDGSYARVDQSLSCGLATKWLFDLPISSGVNLTFRTVKYEDFNQSTVIPEERTNAGNIQFGFRSHLLDMILIGLSAGIDNISYKNPILARMQFHDNPSYQYAFSEIVKRSFQPGTATWVTLSISDDKRNHPVFPTQGHQWIFDSKWAIPNTLGEEDKSFGFVKIGLDARWYTPLIMEYNIILHLHGYIGMVHRIGEYNVPYKELFHIGGPQTVRGFSFGQIGPILLGSSLGASKTFFINAEIQFPINKASSMTGVFFYDGGAGWDTIFINPCIEKENDFFGAFNNNVTSIDHMIQNNTINYRHSVGCGIRLTSPIPLRIDWGFKLDRNRRMGERLYEIHIMMEGSY